MLTAIPIMNKKPQDSLKAGSCLLPISVGQSYHEGESFEATIKLVNKTFTSAVFIVADTLQAHNLRQDNETLDKARERARALGSAWLRRNNAFISQLKIPYKIVWWDEELADENYPLQFSSIKESYDSDKEFKKNLNRTAGHFISRKGNGAGSPDPAGTSKQGEASHSNGENHALLHDLEKSREYLLEECAVFKLWKKHQCEYLLYPKELTPILKYMLKTNEDIALTPLYLKFKTAKQENIKEPSSPEKGKQPQENRITYGGRVNDFSIHRSNSLNVYRSNSPNENRSNSPNGSSSNSPNENRSNSPNGSPSNSPNGSRSNSPSQLDPQSVGKVKYLISVQAEVFQSSLSTDEKNYLASTITKMMYRITSDPANEVIVDDVPGTEPELSAKRIGVLGRS